jgi:hypothetical protein
MLLLLWDGAERFALGRLDVHESQATEIMLKSCWMILVATLAIAMSSEVVNGRLRQEVPAEACSWTAAPSRALLQRTHGRERAPRRVRPLIAAMVVNMCKLMTILPLSAALAGCASAEIGDVDHSCHVNPYDELGSGCAHLRPRDAKLIVAHTIGPRSANVRNDVSALIERVSP